MPPALLEPVLKVNKRHPRFAYCPAEQAEMQVSKSLKGTKGSVEGYAAVFNNVDLGGEVIRKGAFARTLDDVVPKGDVKLMVRHAGHGGDVMDMVGTVTIMKEDDYGLWYKAEFDDDELSQKVRKKVVDGKVKKNSIGFFPIRWDFIKMDGRTVMEHLEAKALEVTLTLFPMNPLAAITNAKSLGEVENQFANFLGKSLTEISQEEAVELLKEHFGDVADAEHFCNFTTKVQERAKALLEKSRSTKAPDPELPKGTTPVPGTLAVPDGKALLREVELLRMKRRTVSLISR